MWDFFCRADRAGRVDRNFGSKMKGERRKEKGENLGSIENIGRLENLENLGNLGIILKHTKLFKLFKLPKLLNFPLILFNSLHLPSPPPLFPLCSLLFPLSSSHFQAFI